MKMEDRGFFGGLDYRKPLKTEFFDIGKKYCAIYFKGGDVEGEDLVAYLTTLVEVMNGKEPLILYCKGEGGDIPEGIVTVILEPSENFHVETSKSFAFNKSLKVLNRCGSHVLYTEKRGEFILSGEDADRIMKVLLGGKVIS